MYAIRSYYDLQPVPGQIEVQPQIVFSQRTGTVLGQAMAQALDIQLQLGNGPARGSQLVGGQKGKPVLTVNGMDTGHQERQRQ